jgi:sulfate adenylyltransferase subunit 1 (EFTu-like GTPase family)
MPWYDGPTLLAHLENLPSETERASASTRFFVQWVIRPQEESLHDYRGYAGRVSSGRLVPGQRVRVLPAGTETTVTRIEVLDGPLPEAKAGQSCVVHLADDLSVGRGDVLVPVDEPAPALVEGFVADLAWLHPSGPRPREAFVLKHGTREVRAAIEVVEGELDVSSGALVPREAPLAMNTLARVRVKVFEPIAADAYAELRDTGCFLLVDAASGATRAGGMVR